MSDITVRPLGEEDWQEYRSVRLEALRESPEAFVATFEEESEIPESEWRDRMVRSDRLIATRDGEVVGVVSIGKTTALEASSEDDDPPVGELFGLWVRPDARGTGVATRLVKQGAARSRDRGETHLIYWVGTENGRAVAFASGIGFRPTDFRRPVGVVSEDDGDFEAAMVLALGVSPGASRL